VPDSKDPYNYDPSNDRCGGYCKESVCFNREHTVPQSWFNSGSIPGSDYMHIMPTDGFVNGKWGNLQFGEVAGAFFYFVIRYQHNIIGWSNNSKAFSKDIFPTINIIYLKMLLQWNAQDPVSQEEIDRNSAAYTYQNNCNPFIDHPEYVAQVWNGSCPGLGTLPVDIIYFAGKLNGNQILLNWKTANAVNLAGFDVEKSYNGTTFFTTAFVNANNSGNYNYTDNIAKETGRRIYYRLKKKDKDDSFTYSEIFSIHIPLNQTFTVAPNPANTVITVSLNLPTVTPATIAIYNEQGKPVASHPCNTGNYTLTLSEAQLPAGSYFVKLQTATSVQQVQKLSISR
jgi:Endonuclease I/Secretion system C-terminal sorting domain